MWPTIYIPHLNRPGIPPPRFYLTTPTYPVEVVEELLGSGDFDRGRFGLGADEAMIVSGAPVSGTLRDILRTYDAPPEDELLSSGEPVSGVLRVVLVAIDAGKEELLVSGEPVSGVLRDPLVVYDNWPLGVDEESLLVSGAPVSGVLA